MRRKRNSGKTRAEHRSNARRHFEDQWRKRICTEPPPWDLLMEQFRLVLSGKKSEFLGIAEYRHHSTRWLAKSGDTTVTIAYNHELGMPLTCWKTRKTEKESFDTHAAAVYMDC